MTKEELAKAVDETLREPDTGKYAIDYTKSLMDLIEEYVDEVIGLNEGWADFVGPYSSTANSYDQDILKQAKEMELTCRYRLRAEQRRGAGITGHGEDRNFLKPSGKGHRTPPTSVRKSKNEPQSDVQTKAT